ncbi:MAG: hypothetical protein COB19_07910 [Porticoccus sp.]|nr:MAG: hypothetical protein COB19_07910 [Porticoccus sp.]
MSKRNMNPLAAAVGAAFMASVTLSPMASATENPFQATELGAGYKLAGDHGEGKCGEAKCGEGKCGEGDKGDKGDKEGKCGEGKCGGQG